MHENRGKGWNVQPPKTSNKKHRHTPYAIEGHPHTTKTERRYGRRHTIGIPSSTATHIPNPTNTPRRFNGW